MSWAAPDDIFFSTSLEAYLDTNAVLEEAYESDIVGELYCDIPLGLYITRGENVVLIGELVKLLTILNEAAHHALYMIVDDN